MRLPDEWEKTQEVVTLKNYCFGSLSPSKIKQVFFNKSLGKLYITGMFFFQLCGRCGISETTMFVLLTLHIGFSLFCHSAKSDAESFCHYFHHYVSVIFRVRGELIPLEPKPLVQHKAWQILVVSSATILRPPSLSALSYPLQSVQ